MAKKKTTEEYVNQAKEKHNCKYDKYGEYYGKDRKIDIHCPIHGWFKQIANNHLRGQGCPMCARERNQKVIEEKKKESKENFYKTITERYCGLYDLSKFLYVNNKTKGIVICHKHGEFKISPNNFLRGHKCPKCGYKEMGRNKISTTEEFISKANKIHKGYYSYESFNYIDAYTNGIIICPIHGEFLQSPRHHLGGSGCPKCGLYKTHIEDDIKNLLKENNISFIEQYRVQWLGLQSLDFYLPDYKVGIECQGKQHFEVVEFFGGEDGLKRTIKRDRLKLQKCKENGVRLLYYSDLGLEYPYEVFEDKDILLKEIINGDNDKI